MSLSSAVVAFRGETLWAWWFIAAMACGMAGLGVAGSGRAADVTRDRLGLWRRVVLRLLLYVPT
jgi:hypothetical protein